MTPSGWVHSVDRRVTPIVGIRERGADRFSRLAEPRLIALEAIAAASLPGLRPRERLGLLVAPLCAGVVGHAMKRLFPRDRPAKHRFEPQGAESFPSTHAAHATALGLAAARVAHRHGAGAWGYGLALTFAGLIGVERIRAAAHWPTDVFAGTLLGVAAAGVTSFLLGRPQR